MLTSEEEFVPPLPKSVTNILSSTQLCYLATCDDSFPHLSLMNFSYSDDNKIVMSTRKNTKKFTALMKNPSVAVLVHDFDSQRKTAARMDDLTAADVMPNNEKPGTFSVTVYGSIVVAEGDEAERLREYHLTCNPQYPQFICGSDIAVLYIQPTLARICNIADSVHTWEVPCVSK